RERAGGVEGSREAVRDRMPPVIAERFDNFWTEQLLVTVALSIVAFALYFFLIHTLSRGFVGFAVGVVVLYLLLNAIVVGSAVKHLVQDPELIMSWERGLREEIGDFRQDAGNVIFMGI